MCQPRASSYDSFDSPNGITRALLLLQCCEARGQLTRCPLSTHLPRASLPPHTLTNGHHPAPQLLICQNRLPEEEEAAACSQEFFESSQSPSILRRQLEPIFGNIQNTDTSSPVAWLRSVDFVRDCPPSFGHYTALNIVGKDPTDQSTSWMSTTDEPSDHEPMLASPVHVSPLTSSILPIFPVLRSRQRASTFPPPKNCIPLKPGRYKCYWHC